MYALSFVFLAFMLCYSQCNPVPEEKESYEAQLERIVEEMSNCMDKNLEPIMSKLSQADHNQWKHMGLSAISSYIHQLSILADEEKRPETKRRPLRSYRHEPDSHEGHWRVNARPAPLDYGFRFSHEDYVSSEEYSSEEFKLPAHLFCES